MASSNTKIIQAFRKWFSGLDVSLRDECLVDHPVEGEGEEIANKHEDLADAEGLSLKHWAKFDGQGVYDIHGNWGGC